MDHDETYMANVNEWRFMVFSKPNYFEMDKLICTAASSPAGDDMQSATYPASPSGGLQSS